MIRAGSRLYAGVFASHGPLVYALTTAYAAVAGTANFSWARLIPIAFALAAAVSVGTSRALAGPTARAGAVALFLAGLAAIWTDRLLHMLDYPSLAGSCAAVMLAAFTVPACYGDRPGRAGAAAAGAAAALLCADAYSYAPAALLLAAGGFCALGPPRTRLAIAFAAGAAAAALPVLLFLTFDGSFTGWFAEHIVFNQTVYARFIGYRPLSVLSQFALQPPPNAMQPWLIGLYLFGAVLIAAPLRSARRAVGLALVLAGIAMLNPRGAATFQGAAFAPAVLALTALGAFRPGLRGAGRFVWVPAVLAVLALESAARADFAANFGHSFPWFGAPHGIGLRSWRRQSPSGLAASIRAATAPTDRILALPYAPVVYLDAARLPATPDFYDLPWQAAWARQGHPGLCSELKATLPIAIYVTNDLIWGRYRLQDYAPCVSSLLATRYALVPTQPGLWILQRQQVP